MEKIPQIGQQVQITDYSFFSEKEIVDVIKKHNSILTVDDVSPVSIGQNGAYEIKYSIWTKEFPTALLPHHTYQIINPNNNTMSNQSPFPIVGQDALVSEISRIIEIFKSSQCQIRPHFILTGASGSGKSLTIKTMAQKYDLGFLEVNAAQLTKEGTSGNSLSKALSPLMQYGARPTIVFVDEFDKLFISGNSNDSAAHESTTGVQNEFLKVIEGDTASVFGDYGKYVNVATANVLFVFAGAFNGEKDITLDRLREIGLKTEFLGRVGLVYNTAPLTIDDLFAIIDRSELLSNYCRLFENADREKITYELRAHVQKCFENNTLGARLINTLIHQYFIKGKLTSDDVKEISFQNKLKL